MTSYYISNEPGDGSNAHAGTSEAAAWHDFAPLHQRSLEPGDKVLLKRGCTWNQQLVISNSGTRDAWCELGAYGAGPRPRIIRNGDALERGVRMNNCSFWKVRDLEVGNCGCGILISYDTPGHEGLVLENLFVHDCYGIFVRDMGDGPARRQASLDRIGIASAIYITCGYTELEPGESVLRDVYIDGIEGCHNADSLAIQARRSGRTDVSYPLRDMVLNHLNLHDDDAPNPGGIPDSLRFVGCEHLLLINSSMDKCCGRYTSSGTAMMFMAGVKDLHFVNNSFTRTPDSGSVDQCAIDFEATTREVKIRNNYFGQNAGPGIEFLDIWGAESFSEGHEVSGNAFEENGQSTHGGQDGSGGIHHYGGNFATGVIRDNLVYEPGRPLYHGEFLSFRLENNREVTGPLFHAVHGFGGEQGMGNWRYQTRPMGGTWRHMAQYDGERQAWLEGEPGKVAWISPYELCNPVVDTELARVWEAPRGGPVAVRGRAVKWQPDGAAASVRVTLNGKLLLHEQAVPVGDWAGIEANLDEVEVQAGDLLRFELAGTANNESDAISWAPTVAYVGS
jgi:hypothetical protein